MLFDESFNKIYYIQQKFNTVWKKLLIMIKIMLILNKLILLIHSQLFSF